MPVDLPTSMYKSLSHHAVQQFGRSVTCADMLCVLQELNDRDKFLHVLLEKYQQADQTGTAAEGNSSGNTGSDSNAAAAGNAVSGGPPLLPEEAVAVILRNERGRQVGFTAPVGSAATSFLAVAAVA